MANWIKTLILFLLPVLACSSCSENPLFAHDESLHDFFQKEEITIAVTDSGLGGLSIMAEAAERSKTWRGFRKINFIFFNALFSNQGGYNSLATQQEKVSVFDSALLSLENRLHPDLILIGCNTLSAIYDETAFAAQHRAPVRGIIDAGVELASHSLRENPEAKIILFGTQTTVSQQSHRNRLLKKGFLPERIVYQACPDLVNYIENDYKSDETEMLIYAYVDEALQKIGDPHPPLLFSLNCTHYGYSYDFWVEAIKSHGIEPLAILNPNSRMIDFLFPSQIRDRFQKTDIYKNKKESLGGWLRRISPQTAEALENYELKEDLFEWKSLVKIR
jgi:glutamate racemase